MIDTIEQYHQFVALSRPVILVCGKKKISIPCANTIVVKRDLIQANTYNPNNLSDDRMELLKMSILDNGFAFPIVTIYDSEAEKFVVVDGFHRWSISGKLGMSHVPIVVLDHDTSKRMIATIQFNKARGHHQVDLDAEVIRSLIGLGMSEDEIANHLGLDLETVYRYKQLTGIAELFKNAQYSMAWEIQEHEDGE